MTLSRKDIEALIKHLSRDKRLLVAEREVIKFVEDTASEAERTVTPVDHGVLDMKNAIAKLQRQVDEIQLKIEE